VSPLGPLWTTLASLLAFGDHNYGPVTPVALPEITVTRHDGARLSLREAVGAGRVAVQFVFTDCQTACPLLGSLFHNVDQKMGASAGPVELVSISVNPAADTAQKLAAWRKSFQASSRWIALRPEPKDLATLLRVFGETDPAPAAHSKQIYFVDRGHYAARSTELPRAALVAAALRGVAPIAGIGAVAEKPEAESNNEAHSEGQSERGRVGDDVLTVEASRCSNCHGADRRGSQEGKIIVPPLTAVHLLQPQSRRGGPPSRYTSESFCVTLQTGVDPAGIVLSPVMPRYSMSPAACAALWQAISGEVSQR
jgi:cytochrome oxidase Cu insertion factor (SCO1/SenC/PrrC family)